MRRSVAARKGAFSRAIHNCASPRAAPYFLSAAAAYRRAGTCFRLELDSLGFCDPIIWQMAHSLDEAIRTGVPNLYTESLPRTLASALWQRKQKTESKRLAVSI